MASPALAALALSAALAAPGGPIPAAPLTEARQAELVAEARAVVQAMSAASQRLDADAALKDALDGPTALAIGSDGRISDLQTLREDLRAFYAKLASLRFTVLREEYRVLAPDLVLYAWSFKVEATSKKGGGFVIDPEAATFLLRKVDGAWKFVHFHESSGPATRVPPPPAP